MKVVITGANGFVGRRLCSDFVRTGIHVLGIVRRPEGVIPNGERVMIPESASDADWLRVLQGSDAVAHSAARVRAVSRKFRGGARISPDTR